MYVEKLVIHNFCCFDKTEFELNYPGRAPTKNFLIPSQIKNVNLFLGDNGSGKSSVFKALALGILAPVIRSSGFQAEYLVRRKPGENAKSRQKPVSLIKENAEVQVYLTLNEMDAKLPSGKSESVIGQTIIQRTGDFEDVISTAYNNESVWEYIFNNDSSAFLLVGYGANRRTERPEGYSETLRSLRYQRVASLFEEQVGLVPFSFGYLQIKDAGYLEEARVVLNALLPEEISLSHRTDGQKRPLFEHDGVLLPFSALSDGFRVFVGWVWDLLFQMARLKKQNRLKLTEIPGAVIVDEIDLLLHPEWQRLVIQQVADTFPCLQFLFSSHSPLVAGTLEPANIFVIDKRQVEHYRENIYGLTPNQILTSPYFGLHSTRAPGTGTLSDLARRTLRQADNGASVEQANPEDRVLDQKNHALRMLEEIGDG